MSNIANFFGKNTGALGPCQITIDPIVQTGDTGDAIILGSTQGTLLRYTQSKTGLTSDQDGTEPFNQVITGELAEVEANLVKTTHEILAAVIPGYSSYSSGANGMSQSSMIGTDDLSIATPIELILQNNAGEVSTDPDDMLIITSAAASVEAEWSFDASTQRVVNVKFRCYKSSNYVDAVTLKPLFYFTRRALNQGSVIFQT